MKYYIILLSALCMLFSCKNETQEQPVSEAIVVEESVEALQEFEWLIGDWTNTTEEEFSKETWTKESDHRYAGFSYTRVGNDTVFAETLVLEHTKEAVLLTVVAFNQNDNKAVQFKKVPSDNKLFVFENPSHDFPQRIIYTNPVKDSIHAWVEGMVAGKLKKVDFYFSRQ